MPVETTEVFLHSHTDSPPFLYSMIGGRQYLWLLWSQPIILHTHDKFGPMTVTVWGHYFSCTFWMRHSSLHTRGRPTRCTLFL